MRHRNPSVILRSVRRALRAAMRSMRFFRPIVRPRVLSRVDLATLCAHRACLMDGTDCGHQHAGPVAARPAIIGYCPPICGNSRAGEAARTARKLMPVFVPNRFQGKLIVVEGIDGSGKSTQLSLLSQ